MCGGGYDSGQNKIKMHSNESVSAKFNKIKRALSFKNLQFGGF
ncbi:hypothetical protein VCHA52P454_10646 [Vibrio chagasii]|nr:hypothetical protein VCHA52P454_10646 [Vibrio chagasii]